MSFRTKSTQDIPSEQFPVALQLASQAKNSAVAFRAMAVAGSVKVGDLFEGLVNHLFQIRQGLTRAQTTPGMAQYAKDQFNDLAYDVVAEFASMMAEIDLTTAFLEANYPTGPDGHLQTRTFVGDGSGATVSAVITSAAALSALITRLDALIATID